MAVYTRFTKPAEWDYGKLVADAEVNFNWLVSRYGNNLINRE